MALSIDVVFHAILGARSGRQLLDTPSLTSMSVSEHRPNVKEYVPCDSMRLRSAVGGGGRRCRMPLPRGGQ